MIGSLAILAGAALVAGPASAAAAPAPATSDVGEALKIAGAVIGAVAGLIALGWRLFDEFRAFVHVSLSLNTAQAGWVTALTVVENKGLRGKRIDYAFLLIGPDGENPAETARSLGRDAGFEFMLWEPGYYRAMERNLDGPFWRGPRAVIPLPFYYNENVDIADECVTYRCPFEVKSLKPGAYSVRFFVSGRGRLDRSTHDTFLVQG